MDIVLAKSAGFCFGVSNAIKMLDCAIQEKSGTIYTLGEIIHNKQVIDYYTKKGVLVAYSVDDIQKGSSVVIRAHGVCPKVMEHLKKRGLSIFDATCPYVKKIQKLVSDKYKEGYKIIIFGNKDHPEVIGINGYCDNTAYIIANEKEANGLEINADKICVVSQTTQKKDCLEKVFNIFDKKFKNVEKFDTICSATSKRQEEAKSIAKNVDLMFVVGGVTSSNTQKLCEVASRYCKNTLKIEVASEINMQDLEKTKKIGVTAGASTPDWVIKEVLTKMAELENEELDFKTLFEQSLVTLHTGDVVDGTIIGFNEKEAYVDLGYKSDGVIPKAQFSLDPDFRFEGNVKVGDKVKVFVINVSDREGTVLLSKVRVEQGDVKEKLKEYFNNKAVFSVKVVEAVKGGVIALFNGIKIFIPGSQLSDKYVENLESYVKKMVEVRITELDEAKGRIVASAKQVLKEIKDKQLANFWNGIEVGKRIKGVVKNITDYGVFVDVGPVDGLVHISELSWDKIKKPTDVVKEGQELEVEVLDFDREKNKLSLTHKKCLENPWDKFLEKYKEGDIITCKIVRFTGFGAFAEIEKGIDGLIHISEISDYRLSSPKEALKLSQEVRVKILKIGDDKKISLSIKAVEPINPREKVEEAKLKEQEEKLETEHKEELKNTIADNINIEIKE